MFYNITITSWMGADTNIVCWQDIILAVQNASKKGWGTVMDILLWCTPWLVITLKANWRIHRKWWDAEKYIVFYSENLIVHWQSDRKWENWRILRNDGMLRIRLFFSQQIQLRIYNQMMTWIKCWRKWTEDPAYMAIMITGTGVGILFLQIIYGAQYFP